MSLRKIAGQQLDGNGSKTLQAALGISLCLVLLAACGGISELTKERMARSEAAVRQAEQTVGNSESGAVQLQSAKDSLYQGRTAMERGDGEQAERFARLAQLDAELAIAKSQTASARQAAEEVQASIDALREEARRAGPQ